MAYWQAGDPKIEFEALQLIRNLHRQFTADDLHTPEMLALIAERKKDKRIIGAILQSFKRRKVIRPVHYVMSARTDCHNRPIMLWEYVPVMNSQGRLI